MKKFPKTSIILGLVLPALVSAQILGIPVDLFKTVGTGANIVDVSSRIVGFAFGLLLLLAVLFIVYAAYLYLFAGGNPANVQKATQFIIYAIVAIVVAFLARAIVGIVRVILNV